MKVYNIVINESQLQMLLDGLSALPDANVIRQHKPSNGLWDQAPREFAHELAGVKPGCINGLTV
jgi:hypothetical protein